ncbi:P-loop containing nucleoside triphosphate hydrolase protein [Aspergillus venezuelensis]
MSDIEDGQPDCTPLPPLADHGRRRVLDRLLRGNEPFEETCVIYEPDDTSVPDRADDTSCLTSLISDAGAGITTLTDADAQAPEDEQENQMGDIDVRAARTNIKRASAIAPSLASAFIKLGLDPLRPAIKLDEATEVLLKPWQVTAMAWMMDQEKRPVKSGILGDGCGLGKTLTALSFLYTSSITGNAPFKPTLIVVPAVLIDSWYTEISTTFGQHIKLRLFHSRQAHVAGDKRQITIDTVEELQSWIAGLSEDRETGRTVVLTSYNTWSKRTLEVLPGSKAAANPEATAESENGQDEAGSDGSPSTTVQEKPNDGSSPDHYSSGIAALVRLQEQVKRKSRKSMTGEDAEEPFKSFLESCKWRPMWKSRLSGFFDRVICDEGHAIKRISSLRHQSVDALRCAHLWILSATPILNKALDLCGLLGAMYDPAWERNADSESEIITKDTAVETLLSPVTLAKLAREGNLDASTGFRSLYH